MVGYIRQGEIVPSGGLDKELTSHFFEQLGNQFNRCLEPTLQCQEKAMGSLDTKFWSAGFA
ncbi:MAG: hypothetical protein KIT26_12560 [Nitrosomonas sp.]|nr:hypothetical protein [Nitrosomonas sp.]